MARPVTVPVREVILLAAGVGKRLAPATEVRPKVIFEIGGRTLLSRHLEHLKAAGIPRLTIVLGHLGEMIRERLEGWEGPPEVRFVKNPDFRRGSVISLLRGLEAAGDGPGRVVWMDADVIYHPRVLYSLFESDAPLTFLLDPIDGEADEEMILGVRGRRVVRIDRGFRMAGDWDLKGESVGFFSLSEALVPRFRAHLEAFIAAGNGDSEYEEAVSALLPDIEAGFVSVEGLPWTEVDFKEDLVKAERVLEELRGLGFD